MVTRQLRRPLASVAFALLAAAGGAPVAAQQDICRPPTDSHEARAFAILSVPIAFTGSSAPGAAHGMSLGLEVASLPTVDHTTATPTSCRPDKTTPENAHPIAGIIRPRLTVAVAGFLLEASWIPPIALNAVKANLVGLAVSHSFHLANNWYIGARAHAVIGSLHAPITCDDRAIEDPASICHRGTRSDDRWRPGVFGSEVVVGKGSAKFSPYFGFGHTLLRPRFQVNFTDVAGLTDRRQVQVNLQRLALFGGVTLAARRSTVTAEAYATQGDAVTARLVVRTTMVR